MADQHYAALIREAELLIAADDGTSLCLRAGRAPHICVGDFDSTGADTLSKAAALGAEIVRYPAEKDESDLDLAVAVARERHVTSVVLTAAFSGRIDHTLAAIGTLVSAADLCAVADEPAWNAYALDATSRAQVELHAQPGTIISVFAVGDATVWIEGVIYPLAGVRLPALSSRGLSNVVADDVQRVRLVDGCAVVVVNRAADCFSYSGSAGSPIIIG
jgi:thiamine pyrophosphokinase